MNIKTSEKIDNIRYVLKHYADRKFTGTIEVKIEFLTGGITENSEISKRMKLK